MPLHRPPLICNRFEVVVLILLSFIISTRLIWLQIDERPPLISDEFYATSTVFKRSLAQSCSKGLDSNFPYSPRTDGYTPLATGTFSPGLEALLLAVCQTKRLTIEGVMDFVPIMIGTSAFLVALTARLLTSTWVGGFIAASVVLSRGSILQGTHLAATLSIQQVMVTLTMLMACLYMRTRDARWLPATFVVCFFSIMMSPLFSLSAWMLSLILLARALNHALRSQFSVHRFRLHLFSTLSMLLIVPVLVLVLRQIMPTSTSAISAVLYHFSPKDAPLNALFVINSSFVTWLSELRKQDFHFHASLALIAVAATWKRHLPRGSGFWAMAVTFLSLVALLVDGALRAFYLAGAESPWALNLKLTGAVEPFEPLIIGSAAAYVWYAVRLVMLALFPSYSSHPVVHDRIK
jgi:hypothetical protein